MPFTTQIPPTSMHGRARRLVIPAQIRVVAQLPWFDQMRDREERTEHDAEAANNHVRDAEEGVLATHHGACAYYDGLCAAVFGYVEVCGVLG
jgi:hypothetical protein